MNPNIDMTGRNRESVATLFGAVLGDQFAIDTRMRNCRWNPPESRDLRTLFDAHYAALDEIMDRMAERAIVLGGPGRQHSPGS